MPSAVIGAAALAWSPNAVLAGQVLPQVAAGETVLTAALSNAGGSYDPSRSSIRVARVGGKLVLDGTARFVPDAHVANRLVVSAADASGAITLALVDLPAHGVAVVVEPTYDQTRRLARVVLDSVELSPECVLADAGEGHQLHTRLVSLGAIAVVCDAVGAAEHSLEMSTAYAKQRMQFGRPIGSFQAVKHHLANMLTDVEASRAAAAFAIDALDSGGDTRSAAAIAKSFAGPACARVAATAIQVHGGIGFTWEHDAHLYLKRTKLDEALFGTAKWHRQHLATRLLDDRVPI